VTHLLARRIAGKTADNLPARARDQVVVSYQCYWDIACRFRERSARRKGGVSGDGFSALE
jgi:hypothetical protein